MNYIDIIGRGPVFPIALDIDSQGNRYWGTLDGDMVILNSDLTGLLAHSIGTMIRQEGIGHRLFELLEEPNNEVLIQLAKSFCVEYINNNENRLQKINSSNITVKANQEKINILIEATLLSGDKIEPVNININK